MRNMSCPLCEAPAEKAKLSCPCCQRELPDDYGSAVNIAMRNIEKLYCQSCRSTFDAYLMGEEERGILKGMIAALMALNEGRNTSCFPLVGFGWKDADLDAEGCTGIKRISGTEAELICFEVGGHKTVVSSDCLDTENEKKRKEFDSIMQEIVCGTNFDGEWTGDDWCLHFTDTVKVAVILKKGKPDYAATAKKVIALARKACEPFHKEMAYVDKQANELYEEYSKDEPWRKGKSKLKSKAKPKVKPSRKAKR